MGLTTTRDMLLHCPALELRQVNRIISQVYDKALAPVRLTSVQFGILTNIVTYPGSAMGALAEMVGVDPTTLKRQLQPLLDRRWVLLNRRQEDARFVAVSATHHGQQVFDEGLNHWIGATNQIEEVIGDERLSAFREEIFHFVRRLRKGLLASGPSV